MGSVKGTVMFCDWRAGLAGVAALLVGAVIAPSSVNAGLVNYELRISESAWVTMDPTNQQFAQQAASVSAAELMAVRDKPYIQLMNTSPPGGNAQITRMSITIGDLFNNVHHFDWVNLFDYSPGITWQYVMPDQANGGVRSDAIDIIFSGFGPGKFVRMQADIDRDLGNMEMLADYRTVIFDLNGPSSADNALVSVHFQEPNLPPAVVSERLSDFVMLEDTNLGIGFINDCPVDTVKVFTQVGSTFIVPEPATITLLVAGVIGVLAGWRRRNG